MDAAHRAIARQRGAAGRRDAVAPPRRDPRGARRRGGRARPTGRRARHVRRAGRHGGRRLRARRRRSSRRSRTTRGRPEVQQARAEGLGIARRYSATLDDRHALRRRPGAQPGRAALATCGWRCRSPSIGEQLAAVRPHCAASPSASGLLAALGLAWAFSALAEPSRSGDRGVAERYARAISHARPATTATTRSARVARVLDDSVRELGQRAAELASDRARMEAILAGMIEGVLVVNEQGRLQLVNGAARRMLRLQDGRRRPALPRNRPAAGHRRAARRALRGAHRRGLELTLPRDRTAASSRGARRRRGAPRRARRRRSVLHDITDLRRADRDAARLRRQRLARAAHAADGRPRLRRGAARRRRRDARCAAVPRDHRPPHAADGAAGPRPAAAGAARRRPGDARARAAARSTSLFDGVETELADCARRRASRSSSTRSRRDAATRAAATRRSCTTRCATCSRTRPTTRRTAAGS